MDQKWECNPLIRFSLANPHSLLKAPYENDVPVQS